MPLFGYFWSNVTKKRLEDSLYAQYMAYEILQTYTEPKRYKHRFLISGRAQVVTKSEKYFEQMLEGLFLTKS